MKIYLPLFAMFFACMGCHRSEFPVPASTPQELIVRAIARTSFPNFQVLVHPQPSDCRPMLQSAIDSCSITGGGHVVVADGDYLLCGPLHLKSNVDLHLDEGAVLRFSGKSQDFLPVVMTRFEGTELYGHSPMIYASHQQNIAITGRGTIDAQACVEMAEWGKVEKILADGASVSKETPDVQRLRTMGEQLIPVQERQFGDGTFLRPACIETYGCSRVLIEEVTIKDSPFWTIHPLYCDNVIVRGVTIDSHNPNNDGCDPESSSNVLIENCLFRCGDDAVAIKSGRDADGRRVGRPSENIVIRNCTFNSECNGLCIGSEMSGGVQNVYMSNVAIGSVKNALYFKSNLDRGGYIRNVHVDSITVSHVQGAVLRFETNYFGYRGGQSPAQYQDFFISNVHALESEHYAIYYDGNQQRPICNVTLTDFIVDRAPRPYYVRFADNCTFVRCWVNGDSISQHPVLSEERQSCDVW